MNIIKSRKYEIYYNDGAFYGSMTFNNQTEAQIQQGIKKEIESNNSNPNKNYHISINNFKIVEEV